MEANASNGGQAKALPAKSKRNRNIMIVVVIAVVVVVALFVVNATIIQNQAESTADFQATSYTIDQSYSGPTTFTVQVSNDGDAYGSGTLYCFVNIGVDSYSNSQTVSLDEGSSTTVTIVVETPYGTTVTESMCGAYF
jgi:flagellar basal body-associated protein FliL